MLQSWVDVVEPVQFNPPYWGAGLEQLRERVCLPPPHVTVHEPQDAQLFQFPLTKKIKPKTALFL